MGDDPEGKLGWTNPSFDDSNWPLLRSDTGWNEQGYKNYNGFAWYRFKVISPARNEDLGICIPRLRTSYEIFADGRLIGQFGGMPPNARIMIDFDQIFRIPADRPSPDREVSIAIRVWHTAWLANANGGGPEGAPTIGEIQVLKAAKAQDDWGRFWSITSGNLLMVMNLLAAFAGFFLFSMRPADREYLWFAIYELLTGVEHLCSAWTMFYPTSWKGNWLLDICLSAPSWVFFLLFVFRILKGHRNWLFWLAVGTAVATLVCSAVAVAEWITFAQWLTAWAVFLLPYFACVLALLYRRARQGVPDAQLMLGPVAICYSSWLTSVVLLALDAAGQTGTDRYFSRFFQLSQWPFPFSVQDLADMLMLLAVLAVLPLRFARSRRDEDRLAGEMESAHTVQQVLIPTEIPIVPGFDMQCVYKPAGQVGGDFFQILAVKDGSVVAVIGDVSGKGMPAAMTVSLLVGTVRTLAHYTQSPSEILAAMNQRMLARSSGGFTTCLVLRCDADGKLTMANAGHIAPYLAGKELPLENGFRWALLRRQPTLSPSSN